jgi:hypothetical protein
MRALPTCLLGIVLGAGCGGGTGVGGGGGGTGGGMTTISTQTLAGKIGGQAWTFATGETNAALSTTDELWVDLYAATFDTCVAFGAPSDADGVTMMMPKKPGSYPLSLGQNATLYVASSSNNWVATHGLLVIDSVTATTISGGMRITYNGDNTVDGQFQAAICPSTGG